MSETLKFGNGLWATKEGSTLAYNSENGNFKPLPFNFTRDTIATRVNKEGLIEVVSNNEPRIDFKDDSNGALLLEPSRSNLVTYSEDFSNAAWIKNGGVSVSLGVISPKGDASAYNVTGLTGSGSNDLINSYSTNPANNTYTYSVYLKGSGTLRIQMSNSIDSSEQVIVTLSSEWQRFELTHTFNSTAATSVSAIHDDSGATATEYDIWGAQLEQGSYATSYIHTSGSIGTRDAESCDNAGNEQVINSTEGVLYFEGSGLSSSVGNKIISLNDGTNTNSFWLYIISSSNGIRIFDGVTIGSFFSVNVYENNKFALVYNSTNTRLFINGSLAITIPFKSMSNLNKLSFSDGNEGQKFEGNVKEIKYFDKALTDQELIALTS